MFKLDCKPHELAAFVLNGLQTNGMDVCDTFGRETVLTDAQVIAQITATIENHTRGLLRGAVR